MVMAGEISRHFFSDTTPVFSKKNLRKHPPPILGAPLRTTFYCKWLQDPITALSHKIFPQRSYCYACGIFYASPCPWPFRPFSWTKPVFRGALMLCRISTGIDVSIERTGHYFLVQFLMGRVLAYFLQGILLYGQQG